MRRLFLATTTALVAATAAQAQDVAPPPDADIASASECEAAIKANPAVAREQAARWSRLGGGTEARLCEAAALEALGADATAAQLLTGLAQNPNRAMGSDLRATTYEDAARLWLRLDRPDLARDALLSANRLTEPEPARFVDLARAEAGLGNWAAARDALDQALALDPGDAGAIALRAATLRHLDDPAAALADARRALALAPDQPEALFEEGAALATQGDAQAAAAAWTRLIEVHPDSDLAAPARRNLQRLSAAAPAPMPLPREQPGPRPRPDVPPRG